MFQLQIHLRRGGRASPLFLATLLLALFFFNTISAREPAGTAATPGFGSLNRYFYLTAANYDTDETLTACASGYHMASLWEMADPSNLSYAGDHPAAFNRADSGAGPPSGWNGWVRTGGVSSGTNTAGRGNCQNWSTTDSASYGTTVKLANAWETPPGEVGVWDATSFSCGLIGPVWCVSEFSYVFVPMISK